MDKIKVGCDHFIRFVGSKDLLSPLLSNPELEWMENGCSTIKNLMDGMVDLLIMPLKWVPVEKQNGTVIAGLSPRLKTNEVLIVNKNDYSENDVLKIPKKGNVGYLYQRQASQLKVLRSDLRLTMVELAGSDLDALIKKNNLSGLIIPQSELTWNGLSMGQHHSIPLHPTELIPQPGEGVLAFLTHADNLYVRRYINDFHNRETALCTNVERRLLLRFEKNKRKNVSAYCYRDQLGHFHASASLVINNDEVAYSSFSQSTHLELDLRLYNLLNQKA